MYVIPLIYFICLAYYFWQKHKTFDVAVYMSILYVITSFCGVLMVVGGYLSSEGGVLVDGWEPDYDIKPTILYCGLITLTILPFSFLRPEKLEEITNVHRFLIYAFTVFVLSHCWLFLFSSTILAWRGVVYG